MSNHSPLTPGQPGRGAITAGTKGGKIK